MLERARRLFHPYPDTPSALRLGFVAAYIGVVGALVVYTNFVSICDAPFAASRRWVMIGILALMLFVERYELTRYVQPSPLPLSIMLILIRMVFLQIIVLLDCTKLAVLLYPVIPFTVFFALGRRYARFFGLFYWLLVAVRVYYLENAGLQTNFDELTVVVVFTLVLIFALVIAGHIDRDERSREQMRELLVKLEASHRQLQAYSMQVAELAAAEERNRLARDIHDSLGHYLTAINIQLEKAEAYRERNPVEADQAIRDARQAARSALRDVRGSVSALRSGVDNFSLKQSLETLIGGLDSSQFSVEYHMTGDEDDYARSVLGVLYRVAQEGLTNVQKHAQASHVLLDVALGPEQARLSLSDDGRGFDAETLSDLASSPDHSFGLQGLRERLELVRGQISVTSEPQQGTELTVIVPKDPAQLALRHLI